MTSRTYIEYILDDLYTEKVYGIELGVLPLSKVRRKPWICRKLISTLRIHNIYPGP